MPIKTQRWRMAVARERPTATPTMIECCDTRAHEEMALRLLNHGATLKVLTHGMPWLRGHTQRLNSRVIACWCSPGGRPVRPYADVACWGVRERTVCIG
jgi:hypothetical protein